MHRKTRRFLNLTLILMSMLPALHSQPEPTAPRLILTPAILGSLRQESLPRERLALYRERLYAQAEELLQTDPIVYEKPDGFRLLPVSRELFDRVTILGLAYRLSGKAAYAEAAVENMLAAAEFPDWNPIHFLDTAEMAAAVGLGMDWLRDVIPEDRRIRLRNAIMGKAVAPYLAAHAGAERGIELEPINWVGLDTNWNLVCNGGIAVAVMAIVDREEREDLHLLETVLAILREQFPIALAAYEPDGAYPEGTMYWGYGSFYAALTLDALATALDDRSLLPAARAFLESANTFFMPTGRGTFR